MTFPVYLTRCVRTLVVSAGLLVNPAPLLADTVDSLVQMHVEGTEQNETQADLLRAAFDKFKHQQYEEALKQLQQAHSEYPHLPPARITLGLFFLDQGQTAPARGQLEQAAIESPDSPLLFDAFGRLALIERRVTDAAVHFDRAIVACNASDWDQGRRERFLRECDLGLATVAERRGLWQQALRCLQRALQRQSDDPRTRRRLAQALFQLGQTDEALQVLTDAIAADPSLEPAELTIARLYGARSDHEQAEAWLKKALEQNPRDVNVVATYGFWLLDRRREPEAAEQAKRATEIAPDDPNTQALKGILARATGRYEFAEKCFQALSVDEPANFDFSNQLVLSLIDQDDKAKQSRAVQLAEHNARLHPQNEHALATLGWAYHRVGEPAMAVEMLRRATSAGVVAADTIYYLARVLAEQGQSEQAKALLEKTLASDGRFINHHLAAAWLKEMKAPPKAKQE